MTQKAAIGLLYDGKNAPSVSVKGFGVLAEEILALAKEKNILIHQGNPTGALFNHRRVNCFFICPARKVSSRLATTQQ
jgi:flagellar biosynthesis protein